MDLPDVEAETNGNYTFLYFIYGFLGILGFCFVVSLGKAIYHCYKMRGTLNVAAVEDSIDTECHSISNELSVSDRQIENAAPDSERLRDQLDKLRRLLNRLNAMGTFSRDTIGDLSAQSAAYVNNSVAASSDLSAFWSSIDFDDFEESTINEGNFRKTPTEKSLSVSDFSLDTSGINFDNFRNKTIPTSQENINNPRNLNFQTNPSDALVQILNILDSIVQKNRNSAGTSQTNTLKNDNRSDKSKNYKALSQSVHSMESYISQKMPVLSSSIVSVGKNESSKCESFNSDTLVSTSGFINHENMNTIPKSVGSVFESRPNLLDQLSQFIDTQYKMSSKVLMEAKVSKGLSVVNIASSSRSKSVDDMKFLTSSKSLDNKKISVSRSVTVYIDPVTCLSNRMKEKSESSLAVPREPYLLTNQDAGKRLSKTRVTGLSPCTVDIKTTLNRSLSLSDLLNNKSPKLSNRFGADLSYDQKKSKAHDFTFEKKPVPMIIISEHPQDPEMSSPKGSEILDKEKSRKESGATQIINNEFSSISSKSLSSPVFSDYITMKTSVSESCVKQSPSSGILSPNLSSAGSDAFLTPVLATGLSPIEKVDWKSPVEPLSDNSVSRNLTPHNVNAAPSRKSCIWSTPPAPEETI